MDDKLEHLLERLPDREAARRLYARLGAEEPARLAALRRKPAALANLLTLAAHSPWLADALLAQPDTIDWLARHRSLDRNYTRETFLEELGRFAARHAGHDEQFILAAFKRRELTRITLRDCLRIAPLSETTEDLSYLADATLDRALTLARQTLVNRYGVPHTTDERGRHVEAEFAIVALGKLGSRELNYASDIDLMFLYSGPGHTTHTAQAAGAQSVDNHTFFTRLAEALVKLVGSPGTTAPVYRVDLRLRPYGRDGELTVSLARAVGYYRATAHNWERQMLIRARAAAGSEALVARFLSDLRGVIFHPEPPPEAIAGVRAAMDRIDRKERVHAGGFNVKLGPGGIREIEFITQALQLAYGGQDPWIRAPRVLIGLQRLADKGFLSDSDRASLSDAYVFLRTVEHRIQMAQGVQSHRLPTDAADVATLALRCGYDPNAGDPAAHLLGDLEAHTARVRLVSERVFALGDRGPDPPRPVLARAAFDAERTTAPDERLGASAAEAARPLEEAALLLAKLGAGAGAEPEEAARGARSLLGDIASRMPHPARALRNLAGYLASLATAEDAAAPARVLSGGAGFLDQLVRMLGSGSFFSEMLIARPELAGEIPGMLFCTVARTRQEFLESLTAAVRSEATLAGRMAALRRAWYREIVAVGSHDVLGGCSVRAVNREQTDLAEAALDAACWMAFRELLADGAAAGREPRFSVQALGRLGHMGMDYGSDLDVLVVYDGESPSPALDASQFYGRFAQLLVRALSSLTREGSVYRVDLRLRPDGRSGPLASSLSGLCDYLWTRASAWELTAYLKLRPTAGSGDGFGHWAREHVIASVFGACDRHAALGEDLRAIRLQLERERGHVGRDIKFGRGGMMDVYFVTRYAQLRTRTDFPPERGTLALIEHLGREGALDAGFAADLGAGYALLRRIDHHLRLIGDRHAPRLPEAPDLRDELAAATGSATVAAFDAELAAATDSIRSVFDRVL